MKKKLIIILFLVLFISTSCKKKDKVEYNYRYDADIICTKELVDEVEEDSLDNISNIYLYIKDDLVIKAIYQSVTSSNNGISSYDLYDEIISLYKEIDGITAGRFIDNDKLIFEVSYNYKKIDTKLVKNKLKNIIDHDSLIYLKDELPVSYEEFKKIELDGYECEEK